MCKCCEEINMLRTLTGDKKKYEYDVRISRECYTSNGYEGTVYGGTHVLNYCPECGKRLGE